MPRRIRSLKDATLRALANNISYWSDMIPEDPDGYLYLLSPFEVLDYGLTQDIFDALVKYNTFQPRHIHLLFHSNLHSIDLSKCGKFKLGENALKTLLIRSKKIKSLKISGRTRCSKSWMCAIPKLYTGLQCIVVNHEGICEEFISNLVTNCPALVTFTSSLCAKLPKQSFKMFGQLKSIKFLTLGNADAFSDEALLFILQNCANLTSLSLPMAQIDFKLVDSMIFTSVQSLDLMLCDSIDDISVERIVTSLTQLRALCLSNCHQITNRSLQTITYHCKYLENLNISYSGIMRYSEDLKLLLMGIGYKLHSIDFSGITGIHLAIFGQFCSHLEKLFLNHCPFMATEWTPYETVLNVIKRNGFHDDRILNGLIHKLGKRDQYSLLELCPLLTTLHLDFKKKSSRFFEYDLESILHGGNNLVELALIEMPDFTDQDVKRLKSYMSTESIRRLNLSGNSLVTVEGIWYAIEHMDNLQTIEIKDCEVIKNEFEQLKAQVYRKGYDVEIFGYE